MFVSDWMTRKVYTVSPSNSVSEAIRLLKEKGVKHLPVVSNGKLKGIVSDRNIKDFSPSEATSLDIFELHYLLSKTRISRIMKSNVVTTSPDAPVEKSAMLMLDNNIGCLPVIDKGRLCGIISDRDIFRVLVDITGIRHGGHRIWTVLDDSPGSIKALADIVRKYGFQLQSILTSYEGVKEGQRSVAMRIKGKGNFRQMNLELESTYKKIIVIKG